MSARTVKEAATKLKAEYAKLAPYLWYMELRVQTTVRTIAAFRREHKWYGHDFPYAWALDGYLHLDPGNMIDDRIYFPTPEEDYYFTFEELENIDSILEERYLAWLETHEAEQKQFVAHRRAMLEAELAALDA